MKHDEQQLYDIAKVCQMLSTTSRTLRFYEEKGIIQSTASPFSTRRQYTVVQIEKIRNVLALRALGLSVRTISELQKDDTDLKTALLLRKAQIIATIHAKQNEIQTLNQALMALERGQGQREHQALIPTEPPIREALQEIACVCAHAVIEGKTQELYTHLSPQLITYMPCEVYERVREDTLAPLGTLIALERVESDPEHPYVFYAFATYEHLNLCIKMVFCHDLIEGFWLTYDQPERRSL